MCNRSNNDKQKWLVGAISLAKQVITDTRKTHNQLILNSIRYFIKLPLTFNKVENNRPLTNGISIESPYTDYSFKLRNAPMTMLTLTKQRAALHYVFAAVIFSIYGGRVCPFIESISIWQTTAYSFITFAAMYVARHA